MAAWFASLSDERLAAYGAVFAALVALAIPFLQWAWSILSRPVITVDFENRPRWRRRTPISAQRNDGIYYDTGRVGLFFRLRVRNVGWSTAHAVTGRMVDVFDANGAPLEPFDPVTLHWVGTPVRSTGRIDLLPSQEEYLDVFMVESTPAHPVRDREEITLLLNDHTPRGVLSTFPIRGQVLRVMVSSENAAGSGFELRLPTKAHFAGRFLSVAHRPIDDMGVGLYPWDEQPPTQDIGGLEGAGIDALQAPGAPGSALAGSE